MTSVTVTNIYDRKQKSVTSMKRADHNQTAHAGPLGGSKVQLYDLFNLSA